MSFRADGSFRYDGAWRKVRAAVLARDDGLCQIRDEGCEVQANQVDHVVRPDEGGALYDPDNLRAACARCNRARGGRVGAAKTNAALREGWRWACSQGHTPDAPCPVCGVQPSRKW